MENNESTENMMLLNTIWNALAFLGDAIDTPDEAKKIAGDKERRRSLSMMVVTLFKLDIIISPVLVWVALALKVGGE